MNDYTISAIKDILIIGLIGTLLSIFSIMLLKKDSNKKINLIKGLFALSTVILLAVIITGILILNPFPPLQQNSTNISLKKDPKPTKTVTEPAPKTATKATTKTVTQNTNNIKKDVPNTSTKDKKVTETSNNMKNVTENQAKLTIEEKIKKWNGVIEGPTKIVEEGWNKYYSFYVHELTHDKGFTVFVNMETGEVTCDDATFGDEWKR